MYPAERLSELVSEIGPKRALAMALDEARKRKDRTACERSLVTFLKGGWQYVDPAKYTHGWHLDAIAEHLEAVTRGELRRLIINVPPRTSKSSCVSVAWPAWTWAQQPTNPASGPGVQFLFASHSQRLCERDSVKTRRLIESPWYQDRWGSRFKLTGDQNTKQRFENNKGGYRLATSVGGSLTGEGGQIIVVDDPLNAVEINSEAVIESTISWWDESLSTRLNDPKTGSFVIIMQRLSERDLTGHILEKSIGEWCHLMLPMRYEPARHCTTKLGWSDPRTKDGELLCPNRFGEQEVKELEARLGPYGAAGQLQQSPEVRGGGLLSRDYWRDWQPDDGRFPVCDYIIASLDGAFTAKEENDPSALTVWGTFTNEDGDRSVILLYAFRKWLELHGPEIERLPDETKDDYRQRCEPTWGLVEHVADVCRRFRVKHLLIENKASGITVSQEMQRLYRGEGWSVELYDPKGLDKTARVIRIQPVFSEGQVYAPDRKWAKMVIDECAVFPRGKHDDLVDSTSSGLFWLRNNGFLNRREERRRDELEDARHYKQPAPLYPT